METEGFLMTNRSGLTTQNAVKLLETHGLNELQRTKKINQLQIFLSQFTNILVYLLLGAVVFSFFLGEFLDGYLILIIIILNGIFGYVQEFKAEKAIEALKKISVSVIRVIRDGKETKIDSRKLVPGDIIILEEGDKVPADCTLLESVHLQINEAALTGESIPVEKNAQDSENNTIFTGTIVTHGRAVAKVETTGMNTRFGKIAAELSDIKQEQTPLEKKVDHLGKMLGVFAIIASVSVIIVGLIRNHPLTELLLTSVSLAVAAVPEGLPAVITIALAIGTQRMVRRKAILRKLQAIESLGSMTVIATDKTGTLTKNEMRVSRIWTDGTSYENSDRTVDASVVFAKLLDIGSTANTASVTWKSSDKPAVLGDTTEGALLILAHDHGSDHEKLRNTGKLEEEFSFDATRKTMSVVWKLPDASYEARVKGAPEIILDNCTKILTAKGVDTLTQEKKKKISHELEAYASDGLRVLGFGYKEVKNATLKRDEAESDLIFVGFVGINDPARPEISAAIKAAKNAGIRTIMVTGDNPLTAASIGRSIGLIGADEDVITGKDFEKLSASERSKIVESTHIFARVSPEDKLAIVRLLQKNHHTVGVTGDGINDALAIKQADVGVAMGITGTDVAKETADMVITDDNYATIVSAIEEGRIIFENMKSSIKFLIGCNIGEVLSLVLGLLAGWPIIMTPIQILYINLATDGLPALGLASIPTHGNIMKQKPNRKHSVFTTFDIRWLVEVSVLMTMVTLAGFAIGMAAFDDLTMARTLAFTISVFAQQFVFLDLQARDASFFASLTASKLPLIPLLPFLLHVFIIYIGPVEEIFDTTALPPTYFVLTLLLASLPLLSSEIRKYLFPRWFYPAR